MTLYYLDIPAVLEFIVGEHFEHMLIPPKLLLSLLSIIGLGPSQGKILLIAKVKVLINQMLSHICDNFLILCLIDRVIQKLMLKGYKPNLHHLIYALFLKHSRRLYPRYEQQVRLRVHNQYAHNQINKLMVLGADTSDFLLKLLLP